MLITTVDFLRHGEVAGGNYYRGITNDPLSNLGWEQMKYAVNNRNWDQIISSPLNRCLDFAQYMSSQTNTPLFTDPNWQEINFGDWEKKTADQISPEALMRFYQDPINITPENGESYHSLLYRVSNAWESLIKTHPNQHILVVTHAGVIRCLFNLLLKLPANQLFNIQVDHSSLTRFQCFHDSPDDFITLKFHNLTQPDLYSVRSED